MIKSIQVNLNKKSGSHSGVPSAQSTPRHPHLPLTSHHTTNTNNNNAVFYQEISSNTLEFPNVTISPRNHELHHQKRPSPAIGQHKRQASDQLSLDSFDHPPGIDDGQSPRYEQHFQQQQEIIYDDPAHLNEVRLAAMLSRQRAKETLYGQNSKAIPGHPSSKQRPKSASATGGRYHYDSKYGNNQVIARVAPEGLITKPLELTGRPMSSKATSRPQSRNATVQDNKEKEKRRRDPLVPELQLPLPGSADSPRDTASLQELLFDSLQEYYMNHNGSMIYGEPSCNVPNVYPKGDAEGGSFDVSDTKADLWNAPLAQMMGENKNTVSFTHNLSHFLICLLISLHFMIFTRLST